MARGIEVDWVFIQVNTIRRLIAILVVVVVAGALVMFARHRINQPPDVRAKQAIERARSAQKQLRSEPVPDAWLVELEQAEGQLTEAQESYVAENWEDAISSAESAAYRFERLLGAGKNAVVGVGQLVTIDGRVQVQRAGKSEWQQATVRMPVFNGDFVKSGRDGAVEIMFEDGTMYRMSPNSLLEIHHRSQAGQERGEVKLEVGQVNVLTSGRPSMVTTDTTQTEVGSDSQVALGVDEESRGTTVTAYRGSARVKNASGGEIEVREREQVAAAADGTFTEKQRIPDPPLPVEPGNNASFELTQSPIINLKWQVRKETAAVHLQVSRSKHFLSDQVDVDVPDLRKNAAKLEALAPGTYYWRVAGIGAGDTRSEWSDTQRFRIYTQDRQPLLKDTTPPDLTVKPAQQLGHMFIVEGVAEAGAIVTINGERVEIDSLGNFRKAIEIRESGWTEIVVAAVDPSGNRTERREKVNVEVY